MVTSPIYNIYHQYHTGWIPLSVLRPLDVDLLIGPESHFLSPLLA